ncbi:MAG: metal-binding protein [Aphanocapsa lilacina HA4352-LM1]|jgi:uncharacterized metal-binding protein|nr:metal-binding protein [Aphanocapsa lilacina HA4352-LM1]
MPLGPTHDRITWWSVPAAGAAVWLVSGAFEAALGAACAYLFAGLMFGGDLDTHSVQYRRWGLLRWIWLPYRRIARHRSLFSHGPLVGTLGRLIYLAVVTVSLGVPGALLLERLAGVTLDWQGAWQMLSLWGGANTSTVVWGLVGLELGAISHSLSDWTGSAWKRLVGRRRRRRGQMSGPRLLR